MIFRTTIEPLPQQGLVQHNKGIMLLGSCFSDNIGTRLSDRLFNVTVNPFGTLYNPLSIANSLARMALGREYVGDELFNYNGQWHSWDFHSAFSSTEPRQALEKMNDSLIAGREALKCAQTLIITMGSAMVYTIGPEQYPVANCHKVPAKEFQLRVLYADEIHDMLAEVINGIRESLNPSLNIIFTVSPIRHKAYGMEGNMLSKARLVEAAHHLCSTLAGCVYFPAFEIMMDDLRDYRFYAADMIHPSEVAIDYIYDIFERSFIDAPSRAVADQCRALTQRLRHRHMTDNSESINNFNQQTRKAAALLLEQYPYLNSPLTTYGLQGI